MLGSRLVRLLLIAATVFAAVAWPTRHSTAFAAASDDDDDDASGGGDDDDGGKGGDDDATAGDDDDDADADQPPVTAGGLYSKTTYPISAIERPLTLIDGMVEVRAAIGADLSAGNTFKSFAAGISAHLGIKDSSEVQFELDGHLNNWGTSQMVLPDEPSVGDLLFSVGYEGALSYDFVDFRAALIIPVKHTSSGPNGMNPEKSNKISPGVAIGFPFKYRLKPQVAIIALRNLFTINLGAPDLTPQLGVIVQPIPEFAAIINTGLTLPEFDTDKGFTVPVSISLQFTPTNKVDIGLQFSFPNVKPTKVKVPDPMDPTKTIEVDGPKFFDSRAMAFYANLRF